MDGNRERSQRTHLPSEIVLTPHLGNESSLPASCQTMLHPGIGSGVGTNQQGSGYSLSSASPPVYVNGNGDYDENEAKISEKYVDPPSYEEAIKYMSYLPPNDTNYLRSHQIDHGQFSLSEPNFSPGPYEEPNADNDLIKSACLKTVMLILIIGLVSFLLRLFFNRL